MADEIEGFDGGQSTNTGLTPNSNVICTPSGDSNDDTSLAFMYANRTPYWTPAVSSANTDVENDRDRGNGVVTFTKGLDVSYISLAGGHYQVQVSGHITDSGSTYKITGKVVGTYPSKASS